MIAQGIALEAKRQFLIGMHQPTDTYKSEMVGKNAAITFNDAKIDRATFTAHGAMVYNASKNNAVLCTLNFGNERPVFDGAFELKFPTPTENSALILFA